MNQRDCSLSVLSSFDWSVPGTPELICESAAFARLPYYYFCKPTSIFKQGPANWTSDEKDCRRKRLLFFGARLAQSRIPGKIQDSFILSQIKNSYVDQSYRNSTLIYTNLESIAGILPQLKRMFRRLVYLCADYSDLGEDFIMNSSWADKVLVVPQSMIGKIEKICGNKTEGFPQLTSTYQPRERISPRVVRFLQDIPSPRIVYTGEIGARIDMDLYSRATKEMSHCSFLSFHAGNFEKKGNSYKLPWVEKYEIFQILENSSVGFMPYDTKIMHNLHCVPLKLFEYFQVGLPVVSTKLVNLKCFEPLLSISENAEELIAQLKSSLGEKLESSLRHKRKSVGESHSTKNQTDLVKLIARGF